MPFLLNDYPYTSYDKINLDWILELATDLKEKAESGAFNGKRGPGIFGGVGTVINNEIDYTGRVVYYTLKFQDVGVGDFVLGTDSAAGTNNLYIMKVERVTGNYLESFSITAL